MNIKTTAQKILCFGDSNTWGRIPGKKGQRFPIDVRWTGLLQKTLDENYDVIEEGLCGRTTALDDEDSLGLNGKTYLFPCLESHNPIDMIVLMLGTNDMKEKYNQSPEQIALNIQDLVTTIQLLAKKSSGALPKLILLSPPLIDESVKSVQERYKGAEEKSKQLAPLYQKIAESTDCEFIDIAQSVNPSKVDGYHLDEEAHAKIAEILSEKILLMV